MSVIDVAVKPGIRHKALEDIIIPLLIIVTGVLLRLFHFVDNRSLWGDEALLALNLINRDFAGLAHFPLDYEQYAPLGFLWLERLCVVLFGIGERSLRLISLLCGILALPLFWKLCRYFMSSLGANTALLCLALSAPAVYFSVEVKQYQMELLVTLLVLLAYMHFRNRQSLEDHFLWGVVGGLLVWFSFTSVFMLAATGTAYFLRVLIADRRRQAAIRFLLTGSLWLASFAVNYFLFITVGTRSNYLNQYWKENFFPLLSAPGSIPDWLGRTWLAIFENPLGLEVTVSWIPQWLFPAVGTGLGIIGAAVLYRRNKEYFIALLLPVLLLLGASALEKYPLIQRFLLFYSPVCYLIMALGAEATFSYIRSWIRVPGVAGYLMGGAAFFPLVFYSLYLVYRPHALYNRIDMREAVQWIHSHYQEGDVVYVLNGINPSYLYYKQLLGLKLESEDISQDIFEAGLPDLIRQRMRQDLQGLLEYKRIWCILRPGLKVHSVAGSPELPQSQSDLVLEVLQEVGTRVQVNPFKRAEVYLFERNN